MVLHDINQAIYFSDNVIGLKDGNILFCGEPEKVIDRDSIKQLYDVDLQVETINGSKFVLTV